MNTSAISLLLVGCLTAFFQNCAKHDLKLNVSSLSVSPKASFCTTPSDSIQSNLKFLFIIDRSGSNQQNYEVLPDGSLIPRSGTDIDGARRFSAIESFVRNFQGGDDQFIYWSMVSISTTAAREQNFTNDRAGFLSFIQEQRARTQSLDGGATNYVDALTEGLEMIQEDTEAARTTDPIISSNYVIFFVSDGVPRVGDGTQTSTEVNNLINSYFSYQDANRELVEGVQLNTAYYYASDYTDPNARQMLVNMAGQGRGNFLEFGNGETIDFSRFAIPLRVSRFDLKEFWVYNTNTVWDGNELKRDSDADALSDDMELLLGSNPNLYDTDGNGVGDGVEFRSSGRVSPCQNPDCSPVDVPYSLCSQFVIPGLDGFFEDKDADYLNDCEERILGSEFDNPDTNFDYIPDHLAFVSQTNMVQVSNAGLLDPDNDGVSDYQELKQNTPLRVNNTSVNGIKSMSLTSEIVRQSVDQDCFSYEINNLGFIDKEDVIRIYLMENTQTISEKRLMRSAQKPINDGGARFEQGDFQ